MMGSWFEWEDHGERSRERERDGENVAKKIERESDSYLRSLETNSFHQSP